MEVIYKLQNSMMKWFTARNAIIVGSEDKELEVNQRKL